MIKEQSSSEPTTHLVEMDFKIAFPLLEKFKPKINIPFDSLISN